MSNIIKKVFSKIVLYGLPIFYLLVAVSFYLGTYDSAQIKITLVQIGGVFLIFSWLILKFEDDFFSTIQKNIVIVLPIILFLLSGLFSYFHSPFQLASLNEFLRRFIYCMLSLILIDSFTDKKNIYRLVNVLVIATYIVCIYAVVQFIDTRFFPAPPDKGFDPFIWRWAFGNRIFSTFGNPNFFGDFLVVMGPIILALFLKKRSFYLLFLWILIVFSTIFSYSKGAWLGFGVGFITFAFLFVSFILNIERRKRIALIAIMAFFTISVVASGIVIQLKSRPDSSSFRLFTWISCWEMINTHPVIGTGIGTFYVTYPSYRRPQIFFIEGLHNTETDHPENEYLEIFYDEGMIGLGIFLLLLITFLTVGFKNLSFFRDKNIQKNTLAYLQLGFITALIAQIFHNGVCVSLRFVSSGIMLWLLLGLIIAVSLNYSNKYANLKSLKLPILVKRLCQLMILLMVGYLIFVFYGFFQADKIHAQAIQYSKMGNWDKAIDLYGEVISKNKSFIMPRYFRANNFNDRWKGNDPQQAIDEYQNIWKIAPNYVQSKFLMGLVYTRLWEVCNKQAQYYFQQKDKRNMELEIQKRDIAFSQAVKYFNQYKQIDPIFPLTYYRLAWLYAQTGDLQKAKQEYEQHINFPKLLQEKPYNLYVENWKDRRKNEYSQTYINLGNLDYVMNKVDLSEQDFIKSLELQPNNPEALKNLTAIYKKKNDRVKYNEIVKILKQLYPTDPYVEQISNKH
ncbi:MAG: O-antigen ligase family protein [Endomicrobiia bacterium]|nr:O-antigen ligase family protein [Endomicrobiaceae bacterium]